MAEIGLEWSSPVGPGWLAWLAGPWRRTERADGPEDRVELFRARLGVDTARLDSGDPRPALAAAAVRLRAALGAPGGALARAKALLPAREDLDLTRTHAELWRRATAAGRVETLVGGVPAIVSDLDASGPTSTRLRIEAPAAALGLHVRALAAALQTRADLVHTARLSLELAATIVALAGPGAAVLAVPLASSFIHDLLAEHTASQGR